MVFVTNLTFAPTHDQVSVATDSGYAVYGLLPTRMKYGRATTGNISLVETLFKTNIVALVGGPCNTQWPSNQLQLWDENQGKVIASIDFDSTIRGVKLRREVIIVICDRKITVLRFSGFQTLFEFPTADNPLGLCATSYTSRALIAFPVSPNPTQENNKGVVSLINLEKSDSAQHHPLLINAHENEIVAIALSRDANFLATAGRKGTLIRVFETTQSGALVHEFRRGAQPCTVFSINFNLDSTALVVTSNTGTCHIFAVTQSGIEDSVHNYTSRLSFLQPLVPYFKSEWSIAKINVSTERSIATFGPDGTVFIIFYDGTLLRYSLTNQGSTVSVKALEQTSIIKNEQM